MILVTGILASIIRIQQVTVKYHFQHTHKILLLTAVGFMPDFDQYPNQNLDVNATQLNAVRWRRENKLQHPIKNYFSIHTGNQCFSCHGKLSKNETRTTL